MPDIRRTSVPRLASTVPSPTDMADPELLPNAFMFGQKIPVDCPPRGLQALVPLTDRKPANSVMFALPMMITPALRSLCTTGASEADRMPRRTVDPEVLSVLSWVMMLSFNMIGMPCKTLQSPPILVRSRVQKADSGCLAFWGHSYVSPRREHVRSFPTQGPIESRRGTCHSLFWT